VKTGDLPTTSPNGEGIVLSLCDRTGVMVTPWRDAGYHCIVVDIQHQGLAWEKGVWFVGADLLKPWLPPIANYAFVSAFPPCTNLAVSGARWFKSKGLGALVDGLSLVQRCAEIAEWAGAPWMLENPVSTISSYWRKPDHRFHPYEYGGYLGGLADGYTKLTCLWTGGGFQMPERRPIALSEGHDRIHRMPPSPERGDLRSVTPQGFARAVFEANSRVAVTS